MKKISNIFLHILQHICLVGGVVALVMALLCSRVIVEDREGHIQNYDNTKEAPGTKFEDSQLFNQLLGNSVSDIICYGAIRGQMETDSVFDAHKEVDVTAFANRYSGLQSEYITAEYYLEDLIKWSQYGFETEEVFMTGKQADAFLSNRKTITMVDFENGNYDGGTVSFFNSDIKKHTKTVDVSGNIILEEGESLREDISATILNNRYRTVEGKKIENYVSSWEEYYALCNNLKKASEDLKINYQEYLEYQDYYDNDKSNVVYYICRSIGTDTDVFSNRTAKTKSFETLSKQLKDECSKYIIYDPENMIYETNTLIEEATLRYILNGYEYAYPDNTQILIGVSDEYAVTDIFTQAKVGYDNHSPYFGQYLCGSIVAFIGFLFLLVILTIKEGKARRKDTGEVVIRLKAEDKIPTEIMLLMAVLAGCIFIFATELVLGTELSRIRDLLESRELLMMIGCFVLLISVAFSFFYYSFVRRMKAGTLWKNSLIRRLYHRLEKSALYIYDNAAIVLRVWIPYVVFILLNIVLIAAGEVIGSIVAFVMDVFIGIIIYKSSQDRQRILKGIQKINDGDMEHQIDTTKLHGDNLVLANSVNNIGDGIRNAVATSMKDERMKADLITNVSHDIKTPLTSIINYVDLIKRENVENPKVKEYIEILDVKSQRLKQLTDDLVEASKISSGNIILQWETINLVELLNQTIGEFSEKFEEKQLTPVFRATKNSVLIEADSRRIWRVIENLFNNIFKYALAGTRVYIDLQERRTDKGENQVTLSVLNISANPIKVNTEELTERFIRGDESRTTEGSGLGLSIAKNLTEVQKGKFEIIVDGDLFKVVLTFPLLENQ